MTSAQRLVLAALLVYSGYSVHYLWLLDRTASACQRELQASSDHHELLGAQRICSAAGVDTADMLKVLFPPKPRTDAKLAP